MQHRQTGKKYEILLATAESLFVQFGIRRTSIEEICRKAGISKATFYKHFSNRGELAVVVLNRLITPLRSQIETGLFSTDPFPLRLRRLMELKREGGRLLGQALIEDLIEAPLPEIQEWLAKEQQHSYRQALQFLQDGQASGALNPRFSAEFLLFLFDLGNELFQDPRVKSLYPELLERSEMLNEFLLFGMMTPDSGSQPRLPAGDR